MAAITASMVAELRAKTDSPMMECKKALTEADGNMDKAEEILRVKLGNKASKARVAMAARQANKEFRTMTDLGGIARQGPGRRCLSQQSETRVAFSAKGAISQR